MKSLLHYLPTVVVCLIVLAAGLFAGHKWRKDYSKALDQYQNLTSRSSAVSSSVSTASGNQVVINVDGRSELGAGPREFWLPSPIRPGELGGAAAGAEALTDGHDDGIPEPDGIYRPTRVGRVLFGSRRFSDGNYVGRESSTRGDGS